DATCTAFPAGGSSSAPAAASGAPGATVTCDFGTIALGASKVETLAIKANAAGRLASHFSVSAREPDHDSRKHSLTLTSEVIGTADLALEAEPVSLTSGGTGSLVLTLKNA